MADSDAIIVTFTAPDGQAYNVWCWPHPDGFGSKNRDGRKRRA